MSGVPWEARFMKQTTKLSLVTSLLWATAIVAAAIVKAPGFLTLLLLPLLALSSLIAIQTMTHRAFN
jgi:hypothetical protein